MEQQIAVAMKNLVGDLVLGRFDDLERDGRSGRMSALELREVLADYPGTPTMPPDEAFEDYRFMGQRRVGFRIAWGTDTVPPKAIAEFWLWYDGEPSDLMVKCVCFTDDGRLDKISIWDIYVP